GGYKTVIHNENHNTPMSQKYSLLIITILVSVITSCKIHEQVRSYNQIISPASNGDVLSTLYRLDSIDRFSNPLVNRKYQKLKERYHSRFSNTNEIAEVLSKNEVINDICTFYRDYWKTKMLEAPFNSDSILYDNLSHYLLNNKLTTLSFDELSKTIKDDSELIRVIENEGFHCKFLLINGIQDLLIWDKQSQSEYAVHLPEVKIDVNVIFIESYLLRGASDYATFGYSQIGGWASNNDSSLFCNKGTYKLKSEKFQYSYLKHESMHFVDIKNYPNLEPSDLEYRAKLIELIYCTEKTIFKRLDEFILGASNESRENSHPFANYHLIYQLSIKLFNNEFEADISKWKSLTPEEINKASLELFQKGSELLKANPNLNRIIENVYNIN
ncbi:MAG: hypothetical protein ACOVQG_08305, partial [Crocinitomicaceae bacterium]